MKDGGVDAGMIEMRRCGRRVALRAETFLCMVFWFWKQQSVVGRREDFL
jgi:hypothetical protein